MRTGINRAGKRQESADGLEDRFISFRDGNRRMNISNRTAHRIRGRDGFPPVLFVGGRLKYRESDIDAFIASGGNLDA